MIDGEMLELLLGSDRLRGKKKPKKMADHMVGAPEVSQDMPNGEH